MVGNYSIYKKDCEDGELCYNSEENCGDEVEGLQNSNAGQQVSRHKVSTSFCPFLSCDLYFYLV